MARGSFARRLHTLITRSKPAEMPEANQHQEAEIPEANQRQEVSNAIRNRLTILLAVYDVERQDQEYAGVIAIALVTVGAAFISGGLLFLTSSCQIEAGCKSLPNNWVLGLPIFPLALLGYLVQNLAGALTRENYILRIEQEIASLMEASKDTLPAEATKDTLPVPYFFHLARFIFGGGGWKNLHYQLTTNIVYISLFAIAIGFSFVVIRFNGWHLGSYIAATIYVLMLLAEIAVVLSSLSSKRMDYLREHATRMFREGSSQ
jgi:hypothetical protein